MDPRSLLGETSARKTLHAMTSVPKPSPATSLPRDKMKRFGAKHIKQVPIVIKMSPKMIVNLRPMLSATVPVNKAPIAAPRIAKLTTVSCYVFVISGKSFSKKSVAPAMTAVSYPKQKPDRMLTRVRLVIAPQL